MNTKKLSELRTKSAKKLEERVASEKKKLLVTRAKMKAGKEKNLKKVFGIRKDIAQMMTIIREKQTNQKPEGGKDENI